MTDYESAASGRWCSQLSNDDDLNDEWLELKSSIEDTRDALDALSEFGVEGDIRVQLNDSDGTDLFVCWADTYGPGGKIND